MNDRKCVTLGRGFVFDSTGEKKWWIPLKFIKIRFDRGTAPVDLGFRQEERSQEDRNRYHILLIPQHGNSSKGGWDLGMSPTWTWAMRGWSNLLATKSSGLVVPSVHMAWMKIYYTLLIVVVWIGLAPHRRMCLNAWPMGNGMRRRGLLEEVRHCGMGDLKCPSQCG